MLNTFTHLTRLDRKEQLKGMISTHTPRCVEYYIFIRATHLFNPLSACFQQAKKIFQNVYLINKNLATHLGYFWGQKRGVFRVQNRSFLRCFNDSKIHLINQWGATMKKFWRDDETDNSDNDFTGREDESEAVLQALAWASAFLLGAIVWVIILIWVFLEVK